MENWKIHKNLLTMRIVINKMTLEIENHYW